MNLTTRIGKHERRVLQKGKWKGYGGEVGDSCWPPTEVLFGMVSGHGVGFADPVAAFTKYIKGCAECLSDYATVIATIRQGRQDSSSNFATATG